MAAHAPAKVSIKVSVGSGGGFGLGSAVALVGAAMIAVLAFRFFSVHTDAGTILASLIGLGIFVLLPFAVFRFLLTMPSAANGSTLGLHIVAGILGGYLMVWAWWDAFCLLKDWHGGITQGNALAAIPLGVALWWAVNRASIWLEDTLGLGWPPPKA